MLNYRTNFLPSKFFLFAIISFLSLNVFSQNFSVYGGYDKEDKKLELEWVFFGEDQLPSSFKIMYGRTSDNGAIDITALTLLDEVNAEDVLGQNDLVFGMFASYSYEAEFEIDKSDQYYFFVEASFENTDKSILSNPFEIGRRDYHDNYIEFDSQPENIAFLNKEYTFQVEIDYDGEVNYSLETPDIYMPDLKIDETATITDEGLFQWTPTEIGNYIFSIKASTKREIHISPGNVNVRFTNGSMQFTVAVTDCEDPTGVTVTLIDQDGNSAEGYVSLTPVYSEEEDDDEYDHYKKFVKGNKKFVKGTGNFNLLPGEYKMAYYGDDFMMWYDNTGDYGSAKTLAVECGTNQEITFNVRTDFNGEDQYRIYFEEDFQDHKKYIAQLNSLYKLDINAYYLDDKGNTDSTVELVYSILEGPEDAIIDPATGLINWTPTEVGHYWFEVKAELESDSFIFSEIYLEVEVNEECLVPATVTGFVADQNGKPMKRALVQAFKIFDEFEVDEDGEIEFFDLDFTKHYIAEVIDGNYQLTLDGGSYVLMVKTKMGSMFYGGGFHWEEADILEVDCADSMVVDFKFELPEEEITEISGTVADANGNALMAQIYVEGSNKKGAGRNSWVSYSVSTDTDGSYSVEVPAGLKVIAYAVPNGFNSYPLFWENTFNRDEATVIDTDEDLAGVDFTFEETLDGSIALKGSLVTDQNEDVNLGMILLMPAGEGSLIFIEVDGGSFETVVPAGEYIFFAIAEDTGVIPGFYLENAVATMDWESATTVNITKDWDGELVIMLRTLQEVSGGIARITGAVNKLGTGSVVSNANIYIENAKGKIVMYDKSGVEGEFGMAHIPVGEYKVTVSKVGYQSFETNVTLDNSTPISLNVPLQPMGVTSVEDKIIANSTIYPNPTTENITITTLEALNNSRVSIFDASGNLITSRLANGTVNQFNLNSFANGTYYLQIDGSSSAIQFVVQK